MHTHRKWNLSYKGSSNFHTILNQYCSFLYNLLKGGIARTFSHTFKMILYSSGLKHCCVIPVVSAWIQWKVLEEQLIASSSQTLHYLIFFFHSLKSQKGFHTSVLSPYNPTTATLLFENLFWFNVVLVFTI